MPPKTVKSRHYSLSLQNSVNFCKDFTRDRIFFTPTLLARWYVFPSLPYSQSSLQLKKKAKKHVILKESLLGVGYNPSVLLIGVNYAVGLKRLQKFKKCVLWYVG